MVRRDMEPRQERQRLRGDAHHQRYSDASGRVINYVAHFSDLTELNQREQEVEHIAHFDTLTGLSNRTLLATGLRQAMAQARRRKQTKR